MLKKIYPLVFFISLYSYAQTSVNFTDNFSGIESVLYNPANIADSFYKVDINILSSSTTTGNTYSTVKPLTILKDNKFGLNDLDVFKKISSLDATIDTIFKISKLKDLDSYVSKKEFSEDSNFYGNSTILGPSFLWTVNNYNTVGFTTAIRFNGYAYNFNSELYNQFTEKTYLNNPKKLLDNNFGNLTGYGQAFAWYEVGFTYAGVPIHTPTEFFKVGVSLKFLRGIKTYSFLLNDFTSNFSLNEDVPEDSVLDFNGSVSVSSSDTGANYGQGLDIGIVYEKRNKTLPINNIDKHGNIYYSKAPYSFKISASITDIGFISFNNIKTQTNNVDLNLANSNFAISDYLSIGSNKNQKETYLLPTTGHLNFDYNLNNHWYLNTNLDVYLFSKDRINAMKTVSNISFTPRYESQHISAFLPLSINNFGIYKAGFGIKTGLFYAGSSSVLTNLTNLSKEGDFFIGLKIPIYNSKVVSEYKKGIRKYSLLKIIENIDEEENTDSEL
ncbi:hypothetical protein FHR24_000290 [Wenyingzhuangia heitensis]|uniref:DUF5723 domain-containing protein n=1 Tax=Wenyingzhuangia heitensis TaxID=1487859 RepID=A0ABX0U8A9_9FLAO|nr:DUF5723 family protein [Wenyingzhuangia heitensis]NIJ43851.1 hypothetical protein [Wenyingzhuangia heitensis]